MGKINVLPFAVANLIAAGEVVDRPASVIKELMENSIDAGATRITVEIQHGGVTFMRVADNGCGISAEDLPVAVKRHATSKIQTADDLDGIITLGFRGEALAAIAAVSHMRIITKTPESTMGAMLESFDSDHVELTERGCSSGTTIIVEDLFANVPARRKFLKKDITEAMAVQANVEKVALSRPDIAVTLIIDGTIRLETVGDGSLQNAIYSVFGKDFAGKLIEINTGSDGIGLTGFIGRTDNYRGNRNCQNFFINGRYVKSKTAMAALEQAYTAYIPAEKYPVCVLNLKIDPKRVDVNVHPAKLEVHFSNEKPVFDCVYYSVKLALEENVTRPSLSLEKGWDNKGRMADSFVPVEEHPESVQKRQLSIPMRTPEPERTKVPEPVPVRTDERITRPAPPQSPTAPAADEKAYRQPSADERRTSQPEPGAKKEIPAPIPEGTWKILGVIYNAYIIVDIGEKVLLIDQHAAHERINFEKFKKQMLAEEPASQMLLTSIDVMATEEEIRALDNFREELSRIGFSFTSGKHAVQVTAVPVGIEPEQVPGLLTEMAAQLLQGTGNVRLTRDILFEKALFQMSCKASIKAGRVYTDEDIEWVVRQLMENPEITFCPHGRPVAMELTKKMLDQQFGRE